MSTTLRKELLSNLVFKNRIKQQPDCSKVSISLALEVGAINPESLGFCPLLLIH
jgi:hypothetical protein